MNIPHEQAPPLAPYRSRIASLALLAAITSLAAWLRLHALAAKSFWMDEGFTAACMRLDWRNLLRLLWRREANMALYYMLLRGWTLFGHSEAWYRGLSVLAAVATLPALFALGRRLFGAPAGFAAALLLAVNAYHVRYSQEARSYSLLVFLVTLASYFLVRAVEAGRSRDWKAYVAASTMAVYAHFFGVLLLAAHWVSLRAAPILTAASENRTPGAGATGPLVSQPEYTQAVKRIGWFTLPVWIFIATTGAGVISWIRRPGLPELHEFFEQLTGNGGPWLLGLYAACSLLALVAAVQTWLRSGRSPESWHYALVLAWAAVPLLITLLVSLVRPVFLPRYLIISLPAFALLAAAGLFPPAAPAAQPVVRILTYKFLTLPVLALMVWFSLSGIRAYYPSYGRCAYEYYTDYSATIGPHPMIVAPGHGDRMTWRDFIGKVSPQVLGTVAREHARVWVVLSNPELSADDPVGRQINGMLLCSDRLLESREFAGVRINLYATHQFRR
jgi:uncharacterized membrane protein